MGQSFTATPRTLPDVDEKRLREITRALTTLKILRKFEASELDDEDRKYLSDHPDEEFHGPTKAFHKETLRLLPLIHRKIVAYHNKRGRHVKTIGEVFERNLSTPHSVYCMAMEMAMINFWRKNQPEKWKWKKGKKSHRIVYGKRYLQYLTVLQGYHSETVKALYALSQPTTQEQTGKYIS